MRIQDLQESLPGRSGPTRPEDAAAWVSNCRLRIANDETSTATDTDVELFNKIHGIHGQLMTIAKKLGGRTTVIEVLKLL